MSTKTTAAKPIVKTTKKKRVSLAQFVRNVKMEVRKVVWPTRKETTISTIIVFIMVTLVSIFFFVVDQILSWGVQLILG